MQAPAALLRCTALLSPGARYHLASTRRLLLCQRPLVPLRVARNVSPSEHSFSAAHPQSQHRSHTLHTPLTHPSRTPHTPLTRPSRTPHTPLTQPSHTPQTPLTPTHPPRAGGGREAALCRLGHHGRLLRPPDQRGAAAPVPAGPHDAGAAAGAGARQGGGGSRRTGCALCLACAIASGQLQQARSGGCAPELVAQ